MIGIRWDDDPSPTESSSLIQIFQVLFFVFSSGQHLFLLVLFIVSMNMNIFFHKSIYMYSYSSRVILIPCCMNRVAFECIGGSAEYRIIPACSRISAHFYLYILLGARIMKVEFLIYTFTILSQLYELPQHSRKPMTCLLQIFYCPEEKKGLISVSGHKTLNSLTLGLPPSSTVPGTQDTGSMSVISKITDLIEVTNFIGEPTKSTL